MERDTSSPFTPGLPVPPDLFVGRFSVIKSLKEDIRNATRGRPGVTFLAGERGIGKSSTASLIQSLAERDFGMIGAHTFLGGVTTLKEMVRRIMDGILKDSTRYPWHQKLREVFKSHVRQVGLFGMSFEFQADAKDLAGWVNNLADQLHQLSEQLDRKGVLLILDDINGLASSPDFAHWLKSFVDGMATSRKPAPLHVLMVGLEEKRRKLIDLNPSLARVMNPVDISPWTNAEARDFFANAFKRVGLSASEAALNAMVRFAGGLPVLAHEIGDATFKLASEPTISADVAYEGIWKAAEIIGRKHIQPQVFNAIHSSRYRKIIRKLASLDQKFQRKVAVGHLSKEEAKVFDNFLRKAEGLGVIAKDPEQGPGAYCFVNILHFLYFRIEAGRAGGTSPDRG